MNYLQPTLANYPVLSEQEELALFKQYKHDNDLEAAHKLVLHNMRMVYKIAHRFKGYVTDINDLIQEGTIGLMKAIRDFDPTQGVRLITYAVHKIKEHIAEFCIRNYSIVRIATTKAQRKLFWNRNLLEDENGLEKLGVSEEVNENFNARLSAQIDLDSDEILQLTSNIATPEECLIEKQDLRQLHKLKDSVNLLSAREQLIIRSRYLTLEPKTLHELGAEIGVSYERIRQIEVAALKKLKEIVA